MKKEQVLISICLIAILVLSSGSMVAFAYGGHTIVVKPSGDTTGKTDTAAIQAALNSCTKGEPGCTVQLLSGTYYVSSQITVYGFQGSFVGAGQEQTSIEALGNMPSPTSNTVADPYWTEPPGTSNPWPDIFTFEGGSIAISGMTITDTSPTPTLGWYIDANEGGTFQTAMQAAIEITGLHAMAAVDHVTVVGASGDWYGYNILNAIHFEGSMLPPGWTDPAADVIPLTGTFSITNSVFDNVQTGPYASDLLNSNVAICGNTVTFPIASPTALPYAIGVEDISNTNALICRNQGTVSFGEAIFASQSFLKPGLLPSTVTITDNNIQVNQGANAVVLEDAGEANFGTPATLSAVVSGNTFQNSYAGGNIWYYSVVVSITLKSTIVSSNTIAGGGAVGIYLNGGPGTVSGNTVTGASTGVWLDVASGVHVAGNVIKNSVEYGIAVTSSNAAGYTTPTPTPSSNNFIVGNFVHGSGAYDLYWDEAIGSTNNHWCGNIYTTSYPSVLPSC